MKYVLMFLLVLGFSGCDDEADSVYQHKMKEKIIDKYYKNYPKKCLKLVYSYSTDQLRMNHASTRLLIKLEGCKTRELLLKLHKEK